MTASATWVLGFLGLLLLLFLLWVGYHVLQTRRLQRIAVEFLSFPDADTALMYIELHPQLLSDEVEHFIRILLDRTWDAGEVDLFFSGFLHLLLLVACREEGVEAVRQTLTDRVQTWLDAMRTPAWDRALKFMGQLAADGTATIPGGELDEELVDALSQIMGILRPLADETTAATADEIVRSLRQALEQRQ